MYSVLFIIDCIENKAYCFLWSVLNEKCIVCYRVC
jgi:hypothetical protein